MHEQMNVSIDNRKAKETAINRNYQFSYVIKIYGPQKGNMAVSIKCNRNDIFNKHIIKSLLV